MQLLKTRRIRTEPVPGQLSIGSFRVELGTAQTIGRRQEQQDGFLSRVFSESHCLFAAVADGMGGLSCGRAAAKLVLDTVASELEQRLTCELSPEALPEILVQTVETAGKQLADWCEGQQITAGTTLAMVLLYREELYFCSVGDSRIYLCRGDEMIQLNEDHSLENYLVRCALKQEEVSELNGSVYSYLGQVPIAEIDYSRKGLPLFAGDTLLLCSDGFYQAVSESEIWEMLGRGNIQKQTENLLKQVLKKKMEQQDNATLLMVHCHE